MEESKETRSPILIGCFITLTFLSVAACALYMPLVASLVEGQLLGTDHVYETFDRMNLADPLGVVYEFTFDFIDNIFPQLLP